MTRKRMLLITRVERFQFRQTKMAPCFEVADEMDVDFDTDGTVLSQTCRRIRRMAPYVRRDDWYGERDASESEDELIAEYCD